MRSRVDDYIGNTSELMPWSLVRMALASVAQIAVIPMQDALALGGGHRLNKPGTIEGNWRWRFSWNQVPEGTAERLRHLASVYGRGASEISKYGVL